MIEFKNKILFVGYGAVAECTLPILFKHLKVPAKNVTIMDFENRAAKLKPWTKKGVRFVRDRVTEANMGKLLAKYVGAGDILIDDWTKYRHLWLAAGGIWITHTSAQGSIAELRKLS